MADIDGVRITPLKRIADERGAILHMLRRDSDGFDQFGEIYFSMIYPGAIKGWHQHRSMTLNYAVPVGMIKLVCYDDRSDSKTHGTISETFVGELNYSLVTIPPLVWNGFKCVGDRPALVANCATEPHSPDEIVRMDPFDPRIAYDWSLHNG
jgi:dTDP-4-dehydrorhamnose 3,5-epimerase